MKFLFGLFFRRISNTLSFCTLPICREIFLCASCLAVYLHLKTGVFDFIIMCVRARASIRLCMALFSSLLNICFVLFRWIYLISIWRLYASFFQYIELDLYAFFSCVSFILQPNRCAFFSLRQLKVRAYNPDLGSIKQRISLVFHMFDIVCHFPLSLQKKKKKTEAYTYIFSSTRTTRTTEIDINSGRRWKPFSIQKIWRKNLHLNRYAYVF